MPVTQNYVSHRFPSTANVKYFEDVLENAQDERPIQTVLAATPSLLRCLTLNTKDFWCFDRPAFGAELIPDFLLCCNTSAGQIWSMVELSRTAKVL